MDNKIIDANLLIFFTQDLIVGKKLFPESDISICIRLKTENPSPGLVKGPR